jgi:hypothetical protein
LNPPDVKDWMLRNTGYTIIILGASGTGKSSLSLRLRGLKSVVATQMRTNVPEIASGKLGETSYKAY